MTNDSRARLSRSLVAGALVVIMTCGMSALLARPVSAQSTALSPSSAIVDFGAQQRGQIPNAPREARTTDQDTSTVAKTKKRKRSRGIGKFIGIGVGLIILIIVIVVVVVLIRRRK